MHSMHPFCGIHKILMDQLIEDDMTTFTSDDRQEAYQKKVEEAPYHPGYEDAVVSPTPAYKGMDPAKMLWKSKPLSDEEIYELWCDADNTELLPEMRLKDGSINYIITTFTKLIEERHGIK